MRKAGKDGGYSAPADPGRQAARSDQTRELTAVIVGTSQSGKSTLLETIYDVNGSEKPKDVQGKPIPTGDGSKSCTTLCSTYELLYKMPDAEPFFTTDDAEKMSGQNFRRHTISLPEALVEAKEEEPDAYAGVELDGSGVSRDQYLNLFFSYNLKYKCNERPAPCKGDWVQAKLIDTPGFDDTNKDGNADEQHAFKVLSSVQNAGQLNIFLFVIGKGVHYGGAFQSTFEQYWDIFGKFRDRFVIMHTKWCPIGGAVPFTEDKAGRVQAFRDVFKDGKFQQAQHIEHIFIDSKWGTGKISSPQHKRALAIESLNQLFTVATNHNPVRAKDLEYTKTKLMQDVDAQLSVFLHGKNAGRNDALAQVQDLRAELNSKIQADTTLHKTKLVRKEDVDKRLAQINQSKDHHYNAITKCYAGNYFSKSRSKCEIECKDVTGAHAINCTSYKADKDQSYKHTKWENLKKSASTVSGELVSGWWSGHKGTLTAYVKLSDYHCVEIQNLKSEKGNLTENISTLQASIDDKSESIDKGDTKMKELQRNAEIIGICIGHLQSESFPLSEFSARSMIYEKVKDEQGNYKIPEVSVLFQRYSKVYPEKVNGLTDAP